MLLVYWILIAYAAICFLFNFIYYFCVLTSAPRTLKDLFESFLAALILIIICPCFSIFYFVFLNEFSKLSKVSVFTIHPLTENNKTALRELGFEEGEFISFSNTVYYGFRKSFGLGRVMAVQNDGRVFVLGNKNSEIEFLENAVKRFPKEEAIEE